MCIQRPGDEWEQEASGLSGLGWRNSLTRKAGPLWTGSSVTWWQLQELWGRKPQHQRRIPTQSFLHPRKVQKCYCWSHVYSPLSSRCGGRGLPTWALIGPSWAGKQVHGLGEGCSPPRRSGSHDSTQPTLPDSSSFSKEVSDPDLKTNKKMI